MAFASERGEVRVALLRGINVGGKNRLPMKDLAATFEASGCTDVRTYIQSGNVVYRATEAVARRVPGAVARAIESEHGFASPVVTRTCAELEAAASANPFLKNGVDEKALHVAFLLERPTEPLVARLEPDRSPGDRFAVVGREIYLHCPNGIGRSKLTTSYFDAKLGTVSTLRNWRTVQKLVALARGHAT